jgi:hypothetical protein
LFEVFKYVLWVIPAVIQGCLLGLMVRSGLRREFPSYFSYTIFSVANFLALFSTYHTSYKLYFCVYWVGSIIGIGFGFLVIREIFYSIFRPFDSLRDMARVLFQWVAIVMVLVALVGVVSAGHASTLDRFMQIAFVLERSVYVMQMGLVLFLFLFAGLVGLTARSHIFGISLGFGVFAAGNLAYYTISSGFGMPYGGSTFMLLKIIAYNAACIIWLSYLSKPDPVRTALTLSQPGRSMELHLALQTAGQSANENFMPMIEGLVERVLEKRGTTDHFPHKMN